MAESLGIDYHVAQEDFRKIIQHLQPWMLSNFIMWLDLKVAEFKVIGHMKLDSLLSVTDIREHRHPLATGDQGKISTESETSSSATTVTKECVSSKHSASSIDQERQSQDYQGRQPQNATTQPGDKDLTDSTKRACQTESKERTRIKDTFPGATLESGSSQNVQVIPFQTGPHSTAKRKRVALETPDLDLNFGALGTPQSSLVLKEIDSPSIKNEPSLDMDFGNYGDDDSKDESVNLGLTGDQGSVSGASRGSALYPSSEDNLPYPVTEPFTTADETSTISGLRHMLQSIQSQFVDLERKLETATVTAERGAGGEADPDIDYHMSQNIDQKSVVLGLLSCLQTTLSQCGSSQVPTNYIPSSQVPITSIPSPQVPTTLTPATYHIQFKPRKKAVDEPKSPLVLDPEGKFADVLVSSSRKREAELRCRKIKDNPERYLLNKILDLVFTDEELQNAHGTKSLDQHKQLAIKGLEPDGTRAPFHSNIGHKVVRTFQRPMRVFDTADQPESEELDLQAILGPYEPSDYFKKGSVAFSALQSEVSAAVTKFSLDTGRRPKRIRMLAVQEVFRKLPDIPNNRESWSEINKRISQKIRNSMYYNKIRTEAESEGLSVRQKLKAKSLIKSQKQDLGQADKEVSDIVSERTPRKVKPVGRKTVFDNPDLQAFTSSSSGEIELCVTDVRSLSFQQQE